MADYQNAASRSEQCRPAVICQNQSVSGNGMQERLHIVHCALHLSVCMRIVCIFMKKKKQKTKRTEGVCEQHIRKSTVWEAKEGSAVIKCQTNAEDSRSTNV